MNQENKIGNIYLSELKCFYPLKKTVLVILWAYTFIELILGVINIFVKGIVSFHELMTVVFLSVTLIIPLRFICNYMKLPFRTIPILGLYFDNKDLVEWIGKEEFTQADRSFEIYEGEEWLSICNHYLYKKLIAGFVVEKTAGYFNDTYEYTLWTILYTGDTCQIKLGPKTQKDIQQFTDILKQEFSVAYLYDPNKTVNDDAFIIQRITGLQIDKIVLRDFKLDDPVKKEVRECLMAIWEKDNKDD